jgi:hypothetical protein
VRQFRRAIHPLAIWLTAALIPIQGVLARTFCCHEKPAERIAARSNCCPCRACCPCCHATANPRGNCSWSCECRPPDPREIDSRIEETRRDSDLEALWNVSAAGVDAALLIPGSGHPLPTDGFFRTAGNRDRCVLFCRYLC